MNRAEVLDHYFIGARSQLIDVAAFLDRAQRAEGEDDFRLEAFRKALALLGQDRPDRARRVLLAFSDPTTAPIPSAPGKGACGAWPGNVS